ncbi:MAG: RES family NAD+ phosphorylase [Devosia sp.]|nr:RES family NAD+ phosphorylase [Devosia sp.]
MAIDRSEIESEDCSLCEDCAKHPALKRFIAAYGVRDTVCGICFRDPDEAPYLSAAPEQFVALSNLVKALIRYEYDEERYNRHFGGDEISGLLSDPNPIIHHEETATHRRSALDSEPYLLRLVSDVYPPYESGVALHAGHSDGLQNTLLTALKSGQSELFREARKRIAQENYYVVEPAVRKVFDAIGRRIDNTVAEGTTFYRARIGTDGRYVTFEALSLNPRVRSRPYQGDLLGAPPPPLARGGRLNRAGVSFLYLASDAETAAAEVRPHPGHQLSVGSFRAVREVRLANFNVDIDAFAGSDEQLDLFSFIVATDNAMSRPIVPEAAGHYSITQLVADVARQRGFDGVVFKSSVGAGQNVCLFDSATFEYVPGSAAVKEVAALRYKFSPVEFLLTPQADDRLIKG